MISGATEAIFRGDHAFCFEGVFNRRLSCLAGGPPGGGGGGGFFFFFFVGLFLLVYIFCGVLYVEVLIYFCRWGGGGGGGLFYFYFLS